MDLFVAQHQHHASQSYPQMGGDDGDGSQNQFGFGDTGGGVGQQHPPIPSTTDPHTAPTIDHQAQPPDGTPSPGKPLQSTESMGRTDSSQGGAPPTTASTIVGSDDQGENKVSQPSSEAGQKEQVATVGSPVKSVGDAKVAIILALNAELFR